MGNFILDRGEFSEGTMEERHFYAYVDATDSIEEDSKTEKLFTIFFDSISSRWFDSLEFGELSSPPPSETPLAKAPLSIFTASTRSGIIRDFHKGLTEKQKWFQVEISWDEDIFNADQYFNLFGDLEDGRRRSVNIRSIVPVNAEKNEVLKAVFNLDNLEDASPDEIISALPKNQSFLGAAVYDVGQGNCNSFLTHDGLVGAYFDFGGGVQGHKKTFPTNLKSFCTTYEPPIILSHWDWDHWSSAGRFPRALSLTWIVPRQEIGPTHKDFALSILDAGGKILVWPPDLLSLGTGLIRIEKCTGSGRNHSGLAAMLFQDVNVNPILFPGDARYTAIPSRKRKDFVNLIAPHHGANMKVNFVPAPNPNNPRKVAISCGDPNLWGHPRNETFQTHQNAGWHNFLRTCGGTAYQRGHIGLFWDLRNNPPPLPCNGACNLGIVHY